MHKCSLLSPWLNHCCWHVYRSSGSEWSRHPSTRHHRGRFGLAVSDREEIGLQSLFPLIHGNSSVSFLFYLIDNGCWGNRSAKGIFSLCVLSVPVLWWSGSNDHPPSDSARAREAERPHTKVWTQQDIYHWCDWGALGVHRQQYSGRGGVGAWKEYVHGDAEFGLTQRWHQVEESTWAVSCNPQPLTYYVCICIIVY